MWFKSQKIAHLTSPELSNNPNRDVIVTETTPLLSFFNSHGGHNRSYQVELDTSDQFNSENLVNFFDLAENGQFVSDFKIPHNKELKDKSQYFWRVKAKDANGNVSDWANSRFFVDSESDDKFSGLMRAEIKKVDVSAGYNAKNIVDYDDPGLLTFWQSPPPGEREQWVSFDLGEEKEICRLWILSNVNDQSGWLKSFVLEKSSDNKSWQEIAESKVTNNDTFRNIVDFPPVKAQYFRLLIKEFSGYAAQINEVILYGKYDIPTPKSPTSDYVLIIGNEHNGYTFTELAKCVEKNSDLKTLIVPYFQVSMAMLDELGNKPKAIILSGNNADYPNLPMFEHNGEFEIIRQSDIPILGICAGHQFLAMAYGYTRARSMGWSDISSMRPSRERTKIKILKDDPIFEGISDNFSAPEIHGWAVVEPADEFEIIAAGKYAQAQKSRKRSIYGIQFHAEIDLADNQAKPIIKNFLKIALENKN